MKKLLGLFLVACVSAVLGLGSTGCTKKDSKAPDKAKVTTPPKDGDKKDDKKTDDLPPPPPPKDVKKIDDLPPPPPPKDVKKDDKKDDKKDEKKDDKKNGASLSREITVASLSPAVLNMHVSRYQVQ